MGGMILSTARPQRMYVPGVKYRDRKKTSVYSFDGAEMNAFMSTLLKTRAKGAITLANEMSAKYKGRRQRTWSEQTVYAAVRILKPDLRSQGWYLLSSRKGYSVTQDRAQALASAERWVEHGETMIATAKESVK